MRTIYKYPLNSVGLNPVHMPTGAKVLSCQLQREVPTVWALVEDSGQPLRRLFMVAGSGHALPDTVTWGGFVATLQRGDGIVLHVFEVGA